MIIICKQYGPETRYPAALPPRRTTSPHQCAFQAGEYELARYNPPFTIPMLATNEVHLVLDESSLRK